VLHPHHLPGFATPTWAARIAAHLDSRLDKLERLLMTEASDQAHLDADVQKILDGLTVVEAEIAALKTQPAAAALDFSGLDSAVSRLTADEPATPVVDPPTPPAAP